jgi:hypothetical protein
VIIIHSYLNESTIFKSAVRAVQDTELRCVVPLPSFVDKWQQTCRRAIDFQLTEKLPRMPDNNIPDASGTFVAQTLQLQQFRS